MDIFCLANFADRANFNSPKKNRRFLKTLMNFYAECIELKDYLRVKTFCG
jgi:hypothetical protein